ncbi:LysR family transcriptional regulator [Paraburkholderia sp. FT54]|uniref:LysR family transcriptional regulator n=1 Tax=Paraburkholderia sp. FT54 TaxID=3074437 RepID=UPI002877B7F6|nr:LysR family transcriptional regulator [Paraburkholderia sp. FT54]WNC93470.1 LysR family transcriptional regulator [Paraburkholderia sp. FT54]
MISTEDLHFFITLASAVSLADAARKLDVTPPAVTQRLRLLENRLGMRLIDRSGRRMVLTDEGELLAVHARRICDDIGNLSDTLASRRGTVAGHLRVIAPLGFGQRYVAPAIAQFRALYPEVSASLILSDRPARISDDTWDLMVHIGELRDSSLISRRLAPNRRILCAAPSYLMRRGEPRHPEELLTHDCIALRENDEDVTMWRFTPKDHGTPANVRIEPMLTSNDGGTVRDWALAGLGIIARSEWDVAEHLHAGRLVPLLEAWTQPDADIVALINSRHGRSLRAQRFLDLLHASTLQQPWLPRPGSEQTRSGTRAHDLGAAGLTARANAA